MSQTEAVLEPRLAHFPVTFYATVMGLAGLTLATHVVETWFGVGALASHVFLAATVLAFVSISVFFAVKWRRHRAQFRAEWNHPVKKAFFPAISISLLLIATALAPSVPDVARGIWLLGAALQAVLTLAVISGWIGHRPFQPMHISPAWFIPAVGNVVAPVAGVGLGFVELSWLFFSAGLVFWLILLVLVMNRLIFHDPLPGKLLPTVAILIAPPAVGFLAWINLNSGQPDALARILLNAAYLFAALVAVQAPKIRKTPFALSWWALSFPIAALTIATFRYAAMTDSGVHGGLGLLFFLMLLAIMVLLVVRTLRAIGAKEICVQE
ncbi:SLAC1 anion channel family protein [Tropicimonas sp. IMCC6043]|uniref:SLAC1 anion channel family protein n=1 Tax=Tropicimonas sp. IMCC6043 TaxID=2510645 RepID=UPI00101BEDCE|nr:SLAC1 anion channel family protein [Tropicimonas sp. IMCC6043]RYH12099.1 C4-dicarboxylate ABC transporter [Tropicimonas sp. IMCC6043]